MRYLLALIPIVIAGCTTGSQMASNPKGEFATIQVSRSNSILPKVQRGDAAAMKQVLQQPGSYAPPVLYALSDALFDAGRRNDAMVYFYLGQLRARSDANKSRDPSAAAAVDTLNQRYGTPINKYAFQDVPKLRRTVEQVIVRDRDLPRDYDQRWIALHGMDAFRATKIRFVPKSEWDAINAKTRRDYLTEFNQALRMYGMEG